MPTSGESAKEGGKASSGGDHLLVLGIGDDDRNLYPTLGDDLRAIIHGVLDDSAEFVLCFLQLPVLDHWTPPI